MKKSLAVIFVLSCLGPAALAVKPLETKGFDIYRNNIKLDIVSLGYVSPQFEWEHFTGTRFSYGLYVQAHFMNRSTFVRSYNNEQFPSTVRLDGNSYDLDWSSHPSHLYADVKMDGKTHEVKWDRKYVGLMFCPQGRYYFGRKPDRGGYGAARMDMGVFRETFVVSVTRLSLEEEDELYKQRKEQAKAEGKNPDSVAKTVEDRWRKAGTEKGEIDLGLGMGFGLGFKGWFRKNSRWGFDANCFVKSDWKLGDDQDNFWEWFWGVGLPVDANLSIVYRF